ncbi:MAG: VanZ family protein [Gammaproteobacteria bacterium]|nr:MAG: VanZ family protein [Gammaproteobacteria bacterium]
MSVSRLWWVLGWMQVVILLIATLWPAIDLPGPEGSDKVVHLASFGWLMIWFAQVVDQRRWRLVLLLIAYGALIEVLQSLSGYRHGDWWDLLADSTGVLVAWGAVRWVLPDFLGRFGPVMRS